MEDGKKCYQLGFGYYVGLIDELNYEKAFYWYTKGAEQGHAQSQYGLGNCYKNGEGTNKDFQKAFYWYTKAAEQGYESAQFNLGNCYEKGEGTERDQKKAVYWYTKAAEQGLADAQFFLGYCYEKGEGTERDQKKAFYWYTKSAEQGVENAKQNLANINSSMQKDNSEAFVEFACQIAEIIMDKNDWDDIIFKDGNRLVIHLKQIYHPFIYRGEYHAILKNVYYLSDDYNDIDYLVFRLPQNSRGIYGLKEVSTAQERGDIQDYLEKSNILRTV